LPESNHLTPRGGRKSRPGPEDQALLADSIGVALLVMLDTLSPAERLAFVLHDTFDVPFDQIAAIIERTPAATRQLASRARRRVRTADPGPHRPDRQRKVVAAFLAAAHHGDFDALVALLDPDVVLRADAAAVRMGVAAQINGAAGVASRFCGALGAQLALVDGTAGAVWAPKGRPRVVFTFATTAEGRIIGIEQRAARDLLNHLDVQILEA
jgi:RNA polymerase sigma-70 factor (ECF subfamily)